MRAHFLVFEQQIAQRAAGFQRPMRGVLDELMRGRATDVLSQRNGDGLAENEAVRRAEIVRHVLFVHVQSIHHMRQMCQRSGGEQKNLRQSFPFGVSAAQAALVFLHHRSEHHRNQRGNASCSSEDDRGTDRIAFMRQC